MNKMDKLLLDRFNDSKQYGTPVFTALYGSQNYNLDCDNSDVDTKTVVVPTLSQFVRNKSKVSLVHEYGLNNQDNNEVKDVMSFFENLRKCNPAYLEVLFTKHSDYTRNFEPLLELRNHMVWSNPELLGKALRGMAHQKRAALNKPYESKLAVLAKYGYDPKQLMHCHRLLLLATKLESGMNFGKAMVCDNTERNSLLTLKSGVLTLGEAMASCDTALDELTKVTEVLEKRPSSNVQEEVDRRVYALVEDMLKQELLSKGE